MDSKVLVAVVAIVAVVAVGIGAFFVMNNNDPATLDVDEVRTELRVGDYTEFQQDYDIITEETLDDQKASRLIQTLYWSLNTSNKTTKIIDYKGKTIVCDCYKYSDGNSTITCTIDPKTKVSYEYTYSDGTEAWSIALKDTNLDVSLKQNEQEVVSGSFVLYDYSFHLTSALVLKGEAEYKMSEYDPNTDLGKMDYHVNVGIHEAVKATITQITPSGEIVTDISNKPETKDNFLGDVLFDSFVGSLEGWGYVVTYGDKSTDTIDTLYGKRHITIQTLDAYLPDKDATFVYTLVYGDKGMIYSREMSAEYGDAEKITKRCTWNYEGSSLKI